eukprot:Skav236427  [mRNA]  locus=scaffold1156:33178:39824:+ [translate_table: standard]
MVRSTWDSGEVISEMDLESRRAQDCQDKQSECGDDMMVLESCPYQFQCPSCTCGEACNTTNGTGTCDGSMCVMCLGRTYRCLLSVAVPQPPQFLATWPVVNLWKVAK